MHTDWNEIRSRATRFCEAWKDASYNKSETLSFYSDFFGIFGIKRRAIAGYEKCAKKLENSIGYIDLFWPGMLLVEQKISGRSLQQARDYSDAIKDAEKPRYQLVCDFRTFQLLDRDSGKEWTFALEDLPQNVELFGFMLGDDPRNFSVQADVNIAAFELIAELYDCLRDSGYPKHNLEMFLVQIVFCLFADDTGIFEPRDLLHEFLLYRTSEDGLNTGPLLHHIFQVLNTPVQARQRNLESGLAALPYVDDDLFEDPLAVASFDSNLRARLIEACEFDWSEISPAIFGALFQSVMNRDKRRVIGAHYTTELNILKVIRPLFLDDLENEFDRICELKRNRFFRLREFHQKLRKLTFLDPACGCGNFLIIAYRELRLLEIRVLKQLVKSQQLELDVQDLGVVDVDQFFGIELEEFSARIAQTALWMMDHIMNIELGAAFGTVNTRTALRPKAQIVCADALELDWEEVLSAKDCSYILGNPPFIGSKYQNDAQRKQVQRIARFKRIKGTLDYVCCWFLKAGAYVRDETRIGFVATSSITQGEQIGQLWPLLFERFHLEIAFAHRAFSWSSESRVTAHVHVVVIGLARRGCEPKLKRLFSYESGTEVPEQTHHLAISPYLMPELERFPHVLVQATKRPINGLAPLKTGSQPIDDGLYTFKNAEERDAFLQTEPGAADLIKPYVGAQDLIRGTMRYILDLHEASPEQLAQLPETRKRIRGVRDFRLGSKRIQTVKCADTPRDFYMRVIPDEPYLVIPVTTSERREYVPIAWLEPPVIPSVDTRILLGASLEDFALLTSKMHMTWLRFVGGKLESSFRYSIALVYNTFPPPPGATEPLITIAQEILDERAKYSDKSLATLYDPDFMPRELRALHQKLDRAVDRCYHDTAFSPDRERIEFLFELYQQHVEPLLISKRGYRSFARQVPTQSMIFPSDSAQTPTERGRFIVPDTTADSNEEAQAKIVHQLDIAAKHTHRLDTQTHLGT